MNFPEVVSVKVMNKKNIKDLEGLIGFVSKETHPDLNWDGLEK